MLGRSWANPKDFSFDHIGIGLLDYGTKEIEIKAEAWATAQPMGKNGFARHWHPGARWLGGERAAVQKRRGKARLARFCRSRSSVLCIPITYGETLLGALNIESRNESAFFFFRRTFLILNTAGRISGHSFAQRFSSSMKAAAAIDHRWPDWNQNPALFLGSIVGEVEARFALGETVLRGTDRPGQIQEVNDHVGPISRVDLVLVA